jgi:hypothetical protein
LLRIKLKEIKPHILSLIVSGGDNRLDLDPSTGRNKYHIGFENFPHLIQRGSCTANSVNPDNLSDIESGYQNLKFHGFDSIRSTQGERIYRLLGDNYRNDFDLFFAPSGSDLAYVPLLIAQVLYQTQNITSITSCPEELGSGTQLAVSGKFFYTKNQEQKKKEKGSNVFSKLTIKSKTFPARTSSGKIIDQRIALNETLLKNPDEVKICNLVVGSKSGIEDNLNVIDPEMERVIWTVDLCQLRNPVLLIQKLLDQNCLVLLTGSKFFQAPPFCGVMLIPKPLSRKIAESKTAIDPGFSELFSREDLPYSWSHLRSFFRPFKNRGLLLRWEAAIGEMERFDRIDRRKRNILIQSWYNYVSNLIAQSPLLEPMPDQEQTNSTIISFRVLFPNGSFLTFNDLKQLHKACMYRTSAKFEPPYTHFTLGQPVAYSQGAFIRAAIGAYDIRQLLKTPSWHNDQVIFEIIAEEIQKMYHERLSPSIRTGSIGKTFQ